MKMTLLAATAALCIGAGAAYAENAEDAGWVPNTYFTELHGVIATAPGEPPNDAATTGNYMTVPGPTNTTAATPPAPRSNGS
jgi:hypothetical protein